MTAGPLISAGTPLPGSEVRLLPLSAPAAADRLFRAVLPGTLIAISSKRPGKQRDREGKPYPHPFYALCAERRADFSKIVQGAADSGDEAVYTTLTAFGPSALAFPKREQPYSFAHRHSTHLLGIFVDLDVGRSEEDARDWSQLQSATDTLGHVCGLVENDVIPLPTLMAASGRGIYLFYIFAVAVARKPETIGRHRRLIDECVARLRPLAADRTSGNRVQLFKAPGSPCVSGLVRYAMFERGDVTAPLYTLEWLERFLAVESDPPAPEKDAAQPGTRRRTPKRGPLQSVAFARVRMAELERLVRLRPRWKGLRHHLLLAYSEAARWALRAEYGILRGDELASERTLTFNRSLPDPEDDTVVWSEILNSRLTPRPLRNATIVRNLAISVLETHRAALSSLAHPTIVRERSEAKRLQAEEKKRRLSEIDHRLVAGECVDSIAQIIGVSRSTIYRRRSRNNLMTDSAKKDTPNERHSEFASIR